jgi:hypothetical protein
MLASACVFCCYHDQEFTLKIESFQWLRDGRYMDRHFDSKKFGTLLLKTRLHERRQRLRAESYFTRELAFKKGQPHQSSGISMCNKKTARPMVMNTHNKTDCDFRRAQWRQ